MTFDHRKLRAFLAVVDHGSLGQAAAAAHLTQPTLSRLIHDMEVRLGQRLFERHSKGMALTPAGETLVPRARLLLFEMDQAAEALDALKGLRRGTARVGAVAAAGRGLLAAAVARLIERAPGLRVEVLEASEDRLTDALLRREIDLMIVAGQQPHDDIAIIGECPLDDEFAVFCATDHPLVTQATITLAQLLAERWIMPHAGATPRATFENIIRAHGERPPVVAVETGSIGMMVAVVAASRLLGWLPRPLLAAAATGNAVALLDVPELALRRRFFVQRRRQGVLPDAARELLQQLPLLRS